MLAASLLLAAGVVIVDVPLYVGPLVPTGSLDVALQEAESIFAPGGVRFRWHVSPDGPHDDALAVIVFQAQPESRVVHGCSRGLHDHRLGTTHLRSRRITLWTRQIARAVDGDWDREEVPKVDARRFARALGRVLAHELGHLFLRLNGHHERGLMRKSFSHRSLVSRAQGAFRLSARELDAIRHELESRTKR